MSFKFPPRGPDFVAEEIATVLSSKATMEFRDIFDMVYANLRSKDLARGGEEMLRLRCHEKLQGLVASGFVTKDAMKKYKGVPKMLKEFFKMAAAHNARVSAGTLVHARMWPEAKKADAPKIKAEAAITKLPVKKMKREKRKAVQTR